MHHNSILPSPLRPSKVGVGLQKWFQPIICTQCSVLHIRDTCRIHGNLLHLSTQPTLYWVREKKIEELSPSHPSLTRMFTWTLVANLSYVKVLSAEWHMPAGVGGEAERRRSQAPSSPPSTELLTAVSIYATCRPAIHSNKISSFTTNFIFHKMTDATCNFHFLKWRLLVLTAGGC
jgi:hypothetical protein